MSHSQEENSANDPVIFTECSRSTITILSSSFSTLDTFWFTLLMNANLRRCVQQLTRTINPPFLSLRLSSAWVLSICHTGNRARGSLPLLKLMFFTHCGKGARGKTHVWKFMLQFCWICYHSEGMKDWSPHECGTKFSTFFFFSSLPSTSCYSIFLDNQSSVMKECDVFAMMAWYDDAVLVCAFASTQSPQWAYLIF